MKRKEIIILVLLLAINTISVLITIPNLYYQIFLCILSALVVSLYYTSWNKHDYQQQNISNTIHIDITEQLLEHGFFEWNMETKKTRFSNSIRELLNLPIESDDIYLLFRNIDGNYSKKIIHKP